MSDRMYVYESQAWLMVAPEPTPYIAYEVQWADEDWGDDDPLTPEP